MCPFNLWKSNIVARWICLVEGLPLIESSSLECSFDSFVRLEWALNIQAPCLQVFLGGWSSDYFYYAIHTLVCSLNSVLKSGSSILTTMQAGRSVLLKVASPDWLMLTLPRILMISILSSISKPNSWLSTTRTTDFMGFKLFTVSIIVPLPQPWIILLLAVMMFDSWWLQRVHTVSVTRDQEHPVLCVSSYWLMLQ